ncbi:MAG: DUF3109 family protein [Cytophagales bacterium]
MIVIGNTYISKDIAEKHFVCHLSKCKGACCVEGDMGAPLELGEVSIIEDVFHEVVPYLSEKSKDYIATNGIIVQDDDGEFCTQTIEGAECVFVVFEQDGTSKCAFEIAFKEKKIDFPKPISCHLYPIRVKKYSENYETLNYDKWHICAPACAHGEALKTPLYKFLKQPLIRKYGESWYQELKLIIEKDDISTKNQLT